MRAVAGTPLVFYLIGLLFASMSGCGDTAVTAVDQSTPDRVAAETVTGDVSGGCNDDDPCTEDVELADGTCKFLVQVGHSCDDGDACTSGDSCNDDGVCVGKVNVTCDDGNSCTEDSCVPEEGCVYETAADGQPCEDGALCTVGELCQNGVCVGGIPTDCSPEDEPDDCVTVMCNPATGGCDKVEVLLAGHPCKDGNPCTDGDACDGKGVCAGGKLHDCPVQHPCKTATCNKDANEGTNPCIQDWVEEGVGCEDNNACTDADACKEVDQDTGEMKCTGKPVDCVDENPCTSDSCDKVTGCAYATMADGTPCLKTSDPCAVSGSCQGGECVGAVGNKCDDENPCTDDTCDPDTGECKHEDNQAACNDGNACTENDACGNGACAGILKDCPQVGDPCLEPVCNPATGQCDLPVEDGTVCADGDWCNGEELCVAGQCQAGEPVLCPDDGNDCTLDVCDPVMKGCGIAAEDGIPCGDANVCDGGAACLAGQCVQGQPVVCPDDGNQCSDDVCNPLTGSCGVAVSDDTGCEDGDLCTESDTCQSGVCSSGVPAVCDDANVCTDDGCLPDTGCSYVPNVLDCDDADQCTDGDQCSAGECVGGPTKDCEDEKECTVDSCQPETGCVNENKENGTECGELPGWTCLDGECQCQADCQGKVCGSDGCGSTCGECPSGKACQDGQCNCVPDCTGKQCGDDGCGGECGPCTGPQDACVNFVCVCQPACPGMECGDDGCGQTCGTCTGQDACVDGQCVCQAACGGKECGDDGCGQTCGTCTGQDACVNGQCVCQPACGGKECGTDGCGGSCGACQGLQDACIANKCVCQSECTGRECGNDGCSGSCGDCQCGEECDAGACVFKACAGKECGPDGCGGNCGTCTGPQDQCAEGECVCQPLCEAGECGPDGCGGQCGICANGYECVESTCVCMTPPELLWEQHFGGADDDAAIGVEATPQGEIVVAAWTKSFGAGGHDAWLMELDSNGNQIWDKTYGTSAFETVSGLSSLPGGGYVLAGASEKPGSSSQAWLVRVKPDGTLTSMTEYGLGGTYGEVFRAMKAFDDGTVVAVGSRSIAGTTRAGAVMVGPSGAMVWEDFELSPAGSSTTVARSVEVVAGGFVVAGNRSVGGSSAVWMGKADMDGNLEWDKIVMNTSGADSANAVVSYSGEGYVLAGQKQGDFWMCRTTNDGQLLWERSFWQGGYAEELQDVQVLADGGLLTTGAKAHWNGSNVWVGRTDSNGELLWETVWGDELGSKNAMAVAILEDGYVVVGRADSDVLVLRYSSECPP